MLTRKATRIPPKLNKLIQEMERLDQPRLSRDEKIALQQLVALSKCPEVTQPNVDSVSSSTMGNIRNLIGRTMSAVVERVTSQGENPEVAEEDVQHAFVAGGGGRLQRRVTGHIDQIQDILNDTKGNGDDTPAEKKGRLAETLFFLSSLIGLSMSACVKLLHDLRQHNPAIDIAFLTPEFNAEMTQEQKIKWCAHMANFIGIMRKNEGEILTDGTKIISARPVEGAVIPVASGGFISSVGEGADFKLIYTPPGGGQPLDLPENDVEASAFCMAHFHESADIRTLLNWGDAYQLVTEEELLTMLAEMGQSDNTNDKLISWILEKAFIFHKENAAFQSRLASIGEGVQSSATQMGESIRGVGNTVLSLPGAISPFITPTPQRIAQFAYDYPTPFWIMTLAHRYPREAIFTSLLIAWQLYGPIRSCYSFSTKVYRYLFSKKAPQGQLQIENGQRGGGVQNNTVFYARKRLSNELIKFSKPESHELDMLIRKINETKIIPMTGSKRDRDSQDAVDQVDEIGNDWRKYLRIGGKKTKRASIPKKIKTRRRRTYRK